MKTKIEKLPKSTIKLSVTIESQKVKDAYEEVLNEAIKNTEIEGFRKGNAPKKMVEDKIGVSNLYGDVINKVLQNYYPQALKENSVSPISQPRVEIKEFDLEKDFEFTATVATRPDVKVKDYKKALKDRYNERLEQKKKDNAERLKKGEALDDSHTHMGTNDILDVLLEKAEVEIADLLVEEEADRLMSRLVDQTQSIGLSVEQYLKAQNKTAEDLRKDYSKLAERNIKAELVLAQLVKDENIIVEDKEIEEMLAAVGDPSMAQKMGDPMEKFYIRSILEKNKLISKLIEETEGENYHEHHEHK